VVAAAVAAASMEDAVLIFYMQSVATVEANMNDANSFKLNPS
jgi:hypothetical protein